MSSLYAYHKDDITCVMAIHVDDILWGTLTGDSKKGPVIKMLDSFEVKKIEEG